MAWTTPVTWTVGQVVGASDLNTQVRDNLNYLLSSRANIYARSAGNYTTTSTTNVDVDATNLSFTILPAATKILVTFNGVLTDNQNGNSVWFSLNIDGAGGKDIWFNQPTMNAGVNYPVSWSQVLTVTAGVSHTIKLQWRTSSVGAGTATLYGNASYEAHMALVEVG